MNFLAKWKLRMIWHYTDFGRKVRYEILECDVQQNLKIVDLTGAGDLFAAGFLYGLSKKFSILESGNIASIAAGEIISHFGAKPETNLKNLISKELKWFYLSN